MTALFGIAPSSYGVENPSTWRIEGLSLGLGYEIFIVDLLG